MCGDQFRRGSEWAANGFGGSPQSGEAMTSRDGRSFPKARTVATGKVLGQVTCFGADTAATLAELAQMHEQSRHLLLWLGQSTASGCAPTVTCSQPALSAPTAPLQSPSISAQKHSGEHCSISTQTRKMCDKRAIGAGEY